MVNTDGSNPNLRRDIPGGASMKASPGPIDSHTLDPILL